MLIFIEDTDSFQKAIDQSAKTGELVDYDSSAMVGQNRKKKQGEFSWTPDITLNNWGKC